MIDEIVTRYRDQNIDVIAAIGGGSVMDAGKAISAMMTKKESIKEYLEDVGSRSHDGKKIPFIVQCPQRPAPAVKPQKMP